MVQFWQEASRRRKVDAENQTVYAKQRSRNCTVHFIDGPASLTASAQQRRLAKTRPANASAESKTTEKCRKK